MHLLNASAIENRSIALPGHQFHVLALDGNPVPSPQPVDQLFLGPGERVDAYVEMNQPGVWILGAPEDDVRNAGLGVVVEYAEPAPAAAVGSARKTVLGLHAVWKAGRVGVSRAGGGVAPDDRDGVRKGAARERASSTASWSTASRIRTTRNSC